MKELNRFKEFLNEEEENQMKTLAKLLRDEADQPDNKVGKSIFLKYAAQAEKTDVKDIKSLLRKLEDELIDKHPDTFSGEDDIVGSFLSTSRQFLKENEDDGYDRASKELFDMTWDEVRRENDPRMRQAVHDEVQKDDDTYIDDVQENQSSSQNFYEVTYTALDGNVIGRDVKHFTDEREAIAFHNSLKDNDKIASAIIDKVYYDPKSFLSGRTEQAYYSNPIHKDYLNSRSGDKRFEDPEPIIQFLDRKLKARKEVGTSLALNEFDDKSMEDYGDAMKVDLGAKKTDKDDQTKLMKLKAMMDRERDMKESNLKGIREETSLEEIYKDIMEVDKEEEKIRKELDGMKRPSQDEVNDAFEKFEREAHYLNNKPVGECDAADMSNWKSILRKGGKIMESMARYILYYTTKDGKENSIGFLSGLNAEDEFYELMDDDNVVSAKIENIYYVTKGVQTEFTRDENGKANVKLASGKTFNMGK